MQLELSDAQWASVEEGWLTGPDGRRYVRRTTRTKRKDADALVSDGAPIVLFYWGGQQLTWFDGTDAQDEWKATRARVITDEPLGKGDVEWTAGRWEDEAGRTLLLLTGHC